MKQFNDEFKTQLYRTIKEIESNSLIEIVVVIKPQSGSYRDIVLGASILFSFLVYTFMMFSPISFDVYSIYISVLLAFAIAYVLLSAFPKAEAKLITKKNKDKNVEIFARATFQKAGIRLTSERIGTLFYVSLLEEKVFVLPDRGAKNAVPLQEWQTIEQNMQTIFKHTDIAVELINQLEKCKPIFNQFLPPVENDINELPDNLDVSL